MKAGTDIFNTKKGSILLMAIIFVVVFIGHNFTKLHTSGDSMWSVPTAMSIIKEGNTNLDEYAQIINFYSNYGVNQIDNHYYNDFPLGVSLLAVPLVFTVELYTTYFSEFPLSESILMYGPIRTCGPIEIFVASIIIAIAAIFIFLIARRFLDIKYSFLVVFIFAFCTSTWSTASRALWQHGPSILMLTITLFLMVSARSKPGLIQYASIPLAFSYIIRPTNSISVLLITVLVLIKYRNNFFRYLLWAMLVAIPFIIYNLNIYGNLLPPYYMAQRIGLHPDFLTALAGNIISPGRGVFIFTPVFFLSILGIVIKIKHKQFELQDFILVCIILLHWLAISAFPFWYGGWSIGPRFFSDMVPYFTYFLIPVLGTVSSCAGKKKSIALVIFLGIVLITFFIHYRSVDLNAWLWNRTPVNINNDPGRIWDWNDIQFLR